jgi:hypothetical protein
MARVHAIILVGIDFVAATHDETLERPVTITNVKFAAVRRPLRYSRASSASMCRAIIIDRIIVGIPVAAA